MPKKELPRKQMRQSKSVTAEKLERVARLATQRGAAVLRKYYAKRLTVTFKGDVNLVTEADMASQKAIVETIRSAFPEHDILAEEGGVGHDRSLDGPIWVVDPLDGTTNFAHRFPMFCTSIAFRSNGETLLGMVYHPLLKELFIAHKGKGATLNGRKIRVSRNLILSESLLATGFPYDRRTSPDNNLNFFAHFELAAQCVRRAGSAALDLANLAAGRFDGFWEPKLSPWDVAAGALLVEEAGGQTSDYQGAPFTDLWCGELVASNGKIHPELLSGLATVRSHRP